MDPKLREDSFIKQQVKAHWRWSHSDLTGEKQAPPAWTLWASECWGQRAEPFCSSREVKLAGQPDRNVLIKRKGRKEKKLMSQRKILCLISETEILANDRKSHFIHKTVNFNKLYHLFMQASGGKEGKPLVILSRMFFPMANILFVLLDKRNYTERHRGCVLTYIVRHTLACPVVQWTEGWFPISWTRPSFPS